MTQPDPTRDYANAPFTDLVGLEYDEIRADHVSCHVEIDERHHQPMGLVHGGVYCTVVETLASIGAWLQVRERGLSIVGVSNTTDFLRAHRSGRVDAVATPVHVGRSQQLWQVVITRSSDGKTVARGQVRVQNIDPAVLPN